jgi:cysteine desulfurase
VPGGGRRYNRAIVPRVYLDHNATTPLDPRVREAMLPWLGDRWGNPSSAHRFGQEAGEVVESARERVAELIGARPPEVAFTASGTEANNAVLRSALLGDPEIWTGSRGHGSLTPHLVISAFEHPSVGVAAAQWARTARAELTLVRPDRRGVVDPAAVAAVLRPETRLVALMRAQNEVGTLQPVAETAALCRERGVRVLCDAVQALGKVPVSVAELGVDYLTMGAHKFHGPLGAGGLWVRPGAPFEPLLVGGGQERGRRAGTVAVAAVVGFGRAAELAAAEIGERGRDLAALRDRFEAGLAAALPDAIVHGADAPRLPHTSHVALPGTLNSELMIRLDLAGFAVSTGAACSSGVVEPGPAMVAMEVPREEAVASIRVSFGLGNTAAEVDAFLVALAAEVAALRREAAAAPEAGR